MLARRLPINTKTKLDTILRIQHYALYINYIVLLFFIVRPLFDHFDFYVLSRFLYFILLYHFPVTINLVLSVNSLRIPFFSSPSFVLLVGVLLSFAIFLSSLIISSWLDTILLIL